MLKKKVYRPPRISEPSPCDEVESDDFEFKTTPTFELLGESEGLIQKQLAIFQTVGADQLEVIRDFFSCKQQNTQPALRVQALKPSQPQYIIKWKKSKKKQEEALQNELEKEFLKKEALKSKVSKFRGHLEPEGEKPSSTPDVLNPSNETFVKKSKLAQQKKVPGREDPAAVQQRLMERRTRSEKTVFEKYEEARGKAEKSNEDETLESKVFLVPANSNDSPARQGSNALNEDPAPNQMDSSVFLQSSSALESTAGRPSENVQEHARPDPVSAFYVALENDDRNQTTREDSKSADLSDWDGQKDDTIPPIEAQGSTEPLVPTTADGENATGNTSQNEDATLRNKNTTTVAPQTESEPDESCTVKTEVLDQHRTQENFAIIDLTTDSKSADALSDWDGQKDVPTEPLAPTAADGENATGKTSRNEDATLRNKNTTTVAPQTRSEPDESCNAKTAVLDQHTRQENFAIIDLTTEFEAGQDIIRIEGSLSAEASTDKTMNVQVFPSSIRQLLDERREVENEDPRMVVLEPIDLTDFSEHSDERETSNANALNAPRHIRVVENKRGTGEEEGGTGELEIEVDILGQDDESQPKETSAKNEVGIDAAPLSLPDDAEPNSTRTRKHGGGIDPPETVSTHPTATAHSCDPYVEQAEGIEVDEEQKQERKPVDQTEPVQPDENSPARMSQEDEETTPQPPMSETNGASSMVTEEEHADTASQERQPEQYESNSAEVIDLTNPIAEAPVEFVGFLPVTSPTANFMRQLAQNNDVPSRPQFESKQRNYKIRQCIEANQPNPVAIDVTGLYYHHLNPCKTIKLREYSQRKKASKLEKTQVKNELESTLQILLRDEVSRRRASSKSTEQSEEGARRPPTHLLTPESQLRHEAPRNRLASDGDSSIDSEKSRSTQMSHRRVISSRFIAKHSLADLKEQRNRAAEKIAPFFPLPETRDGPGENKKPSSGGKEYRDSAPRSQSERKERKDDKFKSEGGISVETKRPVNRKSRLTSPVARLRPRFSSPPALYSNEVYTE